RAGKDGLRVSGSFRWRTDPGALRPEPYLADRTRHKGVRFLPREGSLTRLVQTGRGTENNPSRMLSTGRGKETASRHAAGKPSTGSPKDRRDHMVLVGHVNGSE